MPVFNPVHVVNEFVRPEDFGAVGDGYQDDTEAYQLAVEAIDAAGGGILQLSAGKTYRLTDSIRYRTSGTITRGCGSSSVILADGDFGDVLLAYKHDYEVNALEDGLEGMQFVDFQLQSVDVRTTGSAIRIKSSHKSVIERVIIGDQNNLLFNGIWMEAQSCMGISKCEVYFTNIGMYVSGTPFAPPSIPYFGFDGELNSTEFWGPPAVDGAYRIGSVGIYLASGNGGLRMGNNSNVSNVMAGIIAATGNREIFSSGGLYLDNVGNVGWFIGSGVALVDIGQGWGAALGGVTPNHPIQQSIYVQREFIGVFNLTGGQFYFNTDTPGTTNRGDIYLGGNTMGSGGESHSKFCISNASTDRMTIGHGNIGSLSINGGRCTTLTQVSGSGIYEGYQLKGVVGQTDSSVYLGGSDTDPVIDDSLPADGPIDFGETYLNGGSIGDEV